LHVLFGLVPVIGIIAYLILFFVLPLDDPGGASARWTKGQDLGLAIRVPLLWILHLFLLVKVTPVYVEVFSAFGRSLPPMTLLVMNWGSFWNYHFLVLLLPQLSFFAMMICIYSLAPMSTAGRQNYRWTVYSLLLLPTVLWVLGMHQALSLMD
jgi:hypothetical protein